jgi:stage V sporulation protein G
MEITDVRIKLMNDATDRLKAFCTITLDDVFVVRDLKIVDGIKGLFVAMPSRRVMAACSGCRHRNHLRAKFCNDCGRRLDPVDVPLDEEGGPRLHRDIAHPITPEFRERVQSRVLEAYGAAVAAGPKVSDADFDDHIDEERGEAEPVEEGPVTTPAALSEYDSLIADLCVPTRSDGGGADQRSQRAPRDRGAPPRGVQPSGAPPRGAQPPHREPVQRTGPARDGEGRDARSGDGRRGRGRGRHRRGGSDGAAPPGRERDTQRSEVPVHAERRSTQGSAPRSTPAVEQPPPPPRPVQADAGTSHPAEAAEPASFASHALSPILGKLRIPRTQTRAATPATEEGSFGAGVATGSTEDTASRPARAVGTAPAARPTSPPPAKATPAGASRGGQTPQSGKPQGDTDGPSPAPPASSPAPREAAPAPKPEDGGDRDAFGAGLL